MKTIKHHVKSLIIITPKLFTSLSHIDTNRAGCFGSLATPSPELKLNKN